MSPTDHDLLIRIDERVKMLQEDVISRADRAEATAKEAQKLMETHTQSHARTTKVLSGIAAALGAIAGALMSLLLPH